MAFDSKEESVVRVQFKYVNVVLVFTKRKSKLFELLHMFCVDFTDI